MPVNLASIGKNSVKMVPSMKEVKLESLWAEQTVVVTFFRRFGCVFCRQGAKELSLLTPLLASHNVKNIGVGLEEFGLEEFVEGKFFNGDLYVDIEKKTYQDLGYKRYGTFGVMMSLFSKTARDALAKNKVDKLESNLKGDGLQTGGTLVITKGGDQVLLDYRQDNPADQVDTAEILRVLEIPNPAAKDDAKH
ncbi:prostamide/prostaglandin F synthase [Folsomia candida]|uniref:prostamide/prostaglandin F synthase n=1 Tax=Folsomia candida TaxID=158441 RepID=UPI000B8F8449|nr:prostamide/prostaglandin F synthase [Folsomia candida]